jgi:alanyl-tRNA synthetase
VERIKDQLAAAERRGRDLLERAMDGEARRLLASAAGDPLVIVAAYDGWPTEDLRTLAQGLVRLAPCLALLGSRSDKASLVFAQSDGLRHDVPALLREALTKVGGRGGGKGNLAQGAGDGVAALDDALAAAGVRARSLQAPE